MRATTPPMRRWRSRCFPSRAVGIFVAVGSFEIRDSLFVAGIFIAAAGICLAAALGVCLATIGNCLAVAVALLPVIQHGQGLAEKADKSMQEADQDYLDSGRSHGRIQKVLTA
ncbi:hypothetical protein OROHE_024475 [Orobanche hederae]